MISSYPSPPAEDQTQNIAGLYWAEPAGFWREPDGATVTLTGDLPPTPNTSDGWCFTHGCYHPKGEH